MYLLIGLFICFLLQRMIRNILFRYFNFRLMQCFVTYLCLVFSQIKCLTRYSRNVFNLPLMPASDDVLFKSQIPTVKGRWLPISPALQVMENERCSCLCVKYTLYVMKNSRKSVLISHVPPILCNWLLMSTG